MKSLPTGTVTLVFTDIEGSTRLLQALGSRYGTALDVHRRLLRAAWTAHHGIEIDASGDAFFVAFPRAIDALAAAIDGTRALAEFTWPEELSFAVRIGIHSGAPSIANGSYVGLDVHRAARIAAAGHGGQILLSQTTRDLCENNLPERIDLRDLGEARLKDLPHPEHLYQVVAPQLGHDFPPLKTLDRVRNNLPLQPTPFLGRREVAKRLVSMLEHDDVRVLTLMGPGGIGKTRVALEVAAQVADSFPDGVYFVSLSPLTDPSLVADTIAQTLGLRNLGSVSAEEKLTDALAQQCTLLVLDNFEPVVGAAPVIARLVAACPGVKALVTSRIALRLHGEHEFTIPPLELPDVAVVAELSDGVSASGVRRAPDLEALARYPSVALFVEQARAVKADFLLTTANATAIVDICRQLDGLPLAIELAAPRVKLLTPQAIAKRLTKRLELLTDGPRDQPMRQQTMRAAIAWSYDLLGPDERAIFQRMAVFANGWTFEAAEAVCAAPLDAFTGLSALIDQSLIAEREESDNEPRFSQLETIRAYAIEALEASGEAPAARAAHAHFYLRLAEHAQQEARGPEAQVWLARLERELDNVRAALTWAGETGEIAHGLRLATALAFLWHSHGHEREGARWLQELLMRAEASISDVAEADEELRAAYAWGLVRAGALVVYLADYPRATALLERGLAAQRALGDRDHELRTLNMLGVAAQLHDDLQVAARWYEEGLGIARAAGKQDLATIFLNNLGDVAYYQGDLERAATYYAERLEYSERNGDQAGLTVGRQNMGRTLLRQGRIEAAAQSLRQSLAGAWALHDPRRLAEGLEGLAALAGARGEGEQAARLLGAAAQLRETLGTPQPLPERADIEAVTAQARTALGEDAWGRIVAEGRDQSVEQLIDAELNDGEES